MEIAGAITPIVIVAMIGALLRRCHFVRPEFFQQSNRVVFWVGLPCLLFVGVAQPSHNPQLAIQMEAILLAGMAGCILMALIVLTVVRLPRASACAFIQTTYRGNIAFVGLPVTLIAMNAMDTELSGSLLVVLGLTAPLFSIVAVVVLSFGTDAGAASKRRRLLVVTRTTLTNPLLLACAAGFLYSLLSPVSLPVPLERAMRMLGEMALPLALLGVGATLNLKGQAHRLPVTALAATIKLVGAPACGYLAIKLIGLEPQAARAVLIFLACPTAIASFVMADQMQCDSELTADVIALTTVLAPLSLTAAMLVTLP
ncbi:MAG: AEC family transporter [Verrucomicrobia bacterium]|nr:AEC family transporter [Verrucomicrobiota bacterium]